MTPWSSDIALAAAGNEASVEVYANFTGFVWETARDFDALVVFAEVRHHISELSCSACPCP